MNINQNPPISEEEASNVIQLKDHPRVAPAGKGPPSNNWLKKLDVDTHFLARDKQLPTIDMSEYTLIRKEELAYLLLIHMAGKEMPVWVDPARFSNKHELVLILQ